MFRNPFFYTAPLDPKEGEFYLMDKIPGNTSASTAPDYSSAIQNVADSASNTVNSINNGIFRSSGSVAPNQPPPENPPTSEQLLAAMNNGFYTGNSGIFSGSGTAVPNQTYGDIGQQAAGIGADATKAILAALGGGGMFKFFAEGGLANLNVKNGMYLGGPTDGMADKLPATIDGNQEAALSHGEFVIPADVVGHLGNGNSEAGAQRLYGMMDKIRMARTGTTEQGKKINPDKFLPT